MPQKHESRHVAPDRCYSGSLGGRSHSPLGFNGAERVTGIEPAFSAWEADVLPLNYTREGGTEVSVDT